jgi:hypothetical protein
MTASTTPAAASAPSTATTSGQFVPRLRAYVGRAGGAAGDGAARVVLAAACGFGTTRVVRASLSNAARSAATNSVQVA